MRERHDESATPEFSRAKRFGLAVLKLTERLSFGGAIYYTTQEDNIELPTDLLTAIGLGVFATMEKIKYDHQHKNDPDFV